MLGNLVVLQTFVQNEKLRTMNNLYIMNLAIADFLIGMAKGSNCYQPGPIYPDSRQILYEARDGLG